MNKILLLSFFTTSIIFAADDYTFKASGKDAEELKKIVENYNKNKKTNISVKKDDVNKNTIKDNRFLGIGINTAINYDITKGKEIYMQNCAKCHGVNGEKRAYNVSVPLKSLSADAIYTRFVAYNSDSDAGGRLANIMRPVSARTNSTQLGYIISYLKGNGAFETGSDTPKNSTMQTTPTEQGIYIK